MNRLRWLGILVVLALLVGAGGYALLASRDGNTASLAAQPDLAPIGALDLSQYAHALEPRTWSFPQDFGAHPDFQTEWWYYTGNLDTPDGRRFGYQFTIFRRAIAPRAPQSDSEWRSNQMYAAHFTLTDVAGNQFYEAQRLSRPGAGVAGAETEPVYRTWLEDWSVEALNAGATRLVLTAASDPVAVDLTLEAVKPPALQGEGGLSAKGDLPGEASYYVSRPRLATQGTITIGDAAYEVSGLTWMDQEFTTGALSADAQGWDWFGLHLDDGRDLMLAQIRSTDPSAPPVFYLSSLIDADGTVHPLARDDFRIEATDHWSSAHTGVTYPAGWRIRLEQPTPLELTLTPLIADQELTQGNVIYWEGAVSIGGDVSGYGYAELTGYADAMQGRF